ncbi:hypothetical protein ACQV5M_08460 [Leptospira sp. SA-E8]|uniref:hypothetical protein n=1 Tax=Leptospira sp. SA-E8 TaxID=3422259 RepID=UPI003EC03296
MKRIYIILFFFSIWACNQAKSIDIDSAKSPIGLLMDITLSEAINGRDAGPEYMAAGDNCSLFTSNDGISWSISQGESTPFTGCSGGVIYGLAQGNGRWVAVGTLTSTYQTNANNCGLWSSVDGAEWIRHTCPTPSPSTYSNTPLRSVVFGTVGGVGLFFTSGHKMGTGANEDYYGLVSSDGMNWVFKKLGPTPTVDGGLTTTCYLEVDNGVARCSGETGSYSDAILKYNSSSGVWVADADLPDYMGYAALPDTPPNYNPSTSWFYGGPNHSRFTFGQGDSANYVNRKLPGGDWVEVVSNVLMSQYTYGLLLNAAAYKGNLIVALADACTWMNSTDAGTNWNVYDSIGSCTYDNGMPDFLSVTYNPYVKQFVGAGRSGRVVYSETGLEPSAWTILETGFSGTINTLISKP